MLDNTPAQMDAAVEAAAQAFATWSTTDGKTRAGFLNGLAAALEQNADSLVPLADKETSLGAGRLNGELARTTYQLRRFAGLAESGVPFAFVDDPAVAGAPPVGHPAMVRVQMPLGPVAMFAASNFPFAFSVLGGDTASALAAGCTVVVKAHQGHPKLSRAVFELIQQVLAAQSLPAGVVTFVEGAGNAVGLHLVGHEKIAAAAFTGSTRGGIALQAAINQRARPIPFYGELGAVNPVVALPAALQANGAELAQTLAGSITMGAGQFCTNPGTVLLLDDPASDAFVAALAAALELQQPHAMLTEGMRAAYDRGIGHLAAAGNVLVNPAANAATPSPFLAEVSAGQYLASPELREEVFGPSSLIVRCQSQAELLAVLAAIGGSLTVTVWGAEQGDAETQALVRAAMQIAGRVLFKGVPTGVAVTAAMQHGGPFPASTAPMTTSVGDAALGRFLRPVALQDAPAWLVGLEGRPC